MHLYCEKTYLPVSSMLTGCVLSLDRPLVRSEECCVWKVAWPLLLRAVVTEPSVSLREIRERKTTDTPQSNGNSLKCPIKHFVVHFSC